MLNSILKRFSFTNYFDNTFINKLNNIDNYSFNSLDFKQKVVKTILLDGSFHNTNDNIYIIDKLKNDFSYELICIIDKTKNCFIVKYCTENKIKNVCFVDKMNIENLNTFMKNIDFITVFSNRFDYIFKKNLLKRYLFSAYFKKSYISFATAPSLPIIKNYKAGIGISKDANDIKATLSSYAKNFDEAFSLVEFRRFLNNSPTLL